MKKLISLALALVMILSLATVAFAADGGDSEITNLTVHPYVVKKYDPAGGTAPNAEFTFEVGIGQYDNMGSGAIATVPALYIGTAEYKTNITDATDEEVKIYTDEAKTKFNVEDFEVGKYTYTIKEPAGNIAGIDYSTQELTFVLYVTYKQNSQTEKEYQWALMKDGNKVSPELAPFVNTYKNGKLTVTKKITGTGANMSGEFTINVTLTLPSGKTFTEELITEQGPTDTTTKNVGLTTYSQTVTLGNEKTYTFGNLPVGTTVKVEEKDSKGYTVTYKVDSGEFGTDIVNTDVIAGTRAVVVNNDKTSTPVTGIVLDSMPYIILLTLAAAGMFVLLTKKRAREF